MDEARWGAVSQTVHGRAAHSSRRVLTRRVWHTCGDSIQGSENDLRSPWPGVPCCNEKLCALVSLSFDWEGRISC